MANPQRLKPYAALLCAETLAHIDALNRDLVIGPQARGDGDFIQWHLGMVYLIAHEFITRVEGLEQSAEFRYSWERPDRMPAETPGRHFRRSMRDSSFAFIEGLYPNLTPDQLEAWACLYDQVVAVEISREWGGRKVRVPFRRKEADIQSRIAQGLQKQLPLAEVFKQAGISRATGYRILKKKQK